MKVSWSFVVIISCIILETHTSANNGYQFYQKESTYNPPPFPNRGSARMSRTQYLCIALGICSSLLPQPVDSQSSKSPRVVFDWGQLEFDYGSEAERDADVASGVFTPGVIGPIDVDVYYSRLAPDKNHIFITIPRFVTGIPATLGIVSNRNRSGNPIIKPYPDWSWHRDSERCNRNRLVSVFRVKIDECGRLWVLDTGKIGDNFVCQPQIIAFDLETNQVLHRHEIRNETFSMPYLLVNPIVDVRDPNSGCRDTFVYVANVLGFSLIVYDVANDRSWRIQDKTMYPYPSHGTYTIAGESFEFMDGILGMALSPYSAGDDRVLFYHAMSSPTENWVYTSDIRNYTRFRNNPASSPELFHTYRNIRNTQSAAEDINKDGIMFFGLIGDFTIACWNTKTEYGPNHFDIVANNPVTLPFPSGLKIIKNNRGKEELWIITSKFQKLANGSLDPNDRNFRILAINVDDILHGSSCKDKHYSQNQIGGGYGFLGKRS